MNAPLPYDPAQAALACQLSADIYLPWQELRDKYPLATVSEAAPDRVMVVQIGQTIWAGFMGTNNWRALLSDFEVIRHHIGQGREVHTGFFHGVSCLWLALRDAIAARAPLNGHTDLKFFGHSRGASEAIIAARQWHQSGYDFAPVSHVFAFAPARPGNAAFRDDYNKRLGHCTFCFQHGADIVPWEAPWMIGNRGVGHCVWHDDLTSQSILDPSLARMAIYCAAVTWAGWRKSPPQIEQLADHHVDNYLSLFQLSALTLLEPWNSPRGSPVCARSSCWCII